MAILRLIAITCSVGAATCSTASGQWTAVEDFDLTQRSFRYLIKMGSPKEASVDIAVSKMLADRSGRRVDAPGGDANAATVESGLTDGDAGFVKLDSGGWSPPSYHSSKRFIETYPCGFSYEIDARGSALVVEIRPVFELPSGKLVSWTAAGGNRHLKRLQKQLATAQAAQAAIGQLRTAARQAEQQARAQTGSFAQAGNIAIKLNTQLAKAERLATAIDPLKREISAAQLLGQYSTDIVLKSKLYVAVNYRGKVLPLDHEPAQAVDPPLPDDGLRHWTSADGKYRFRAVPVSLSDDQTSVVLRGYDKTVTVPLEKLCAEDQQYIEQWAAEPREPSTEPI